MRHRNLPIEMLREHLRNGGNVLITTAELSRDDLTKGLHMPASEREADDQITAARNVAHAWLHVTLASLPAEVISLSVGALLDDGGDRPTLAPRIKAEVVTPEITLRYPEDYPAEEMESLDALDDGLREMTHPFLFALRDEEWLTVTRAEIASERTAELCGAEHRIDAMASLAHDHTERRWIASKNTAPAVGFYGVDPIPAMDGLILAAIMQEIVDIPRGEDTTLRVYRSAEGDLTWTVLAP